MRCPVNSIRGVSNYPVKTICSISNTPLKLYVLPLQAHTVPPLAYPCLCVGVPLNRLLIW